MRDETRDETSELDGRPAHAARERHGHGTAGATVSIPPRPAAARTMPFGPTTLHARLALLRPQPVRLRPAPGTEK